MKLPGKCKPWHYIWGGLAAMLLLLGLDQWTKYLAVAHLKGQPAIPLIDGVLELQYLENRGAAFGMLENMQWLFVALCVIFVAVALYFYWVMPATRRMLPLHILVILAVSGGIGNAIDRVWHGYVVDFIYVSLIDFPIFNVADCYVTVCAFVLMILIFFYYKEEDFAFLSTRKAEASRTEEEKEQTDL